jgi:hypothetical protein
MPMVDAHSFSFNRDLQPKRWLGHFDLKQVTSARLDASTIREVPGLVAARDELVGVCSSQLCGTNH